MLNLLRGVLVEVASIAAARITARIRRLKEERGETSRLGRQNGVVLVE